MGMLRGLLLSLPLLAVLPAQAMEFVAPDASSARDVVEYDTSADRAALKAHFAEAYARYPRLPQGLLEALAWSQSRWQHLAPAKRADAHQHQPRAFGVMGLYRGEGFANQVEAGAALIGVPGDLVASDARHNILAAAALLDREASSLPSKAAPSDYAEVLQRYASFGGEAKSRIQQFARASFAYDVLLALDRGVNEDGAAVPERAIEWEKAFDVDTLSKLGAPFVRLDASKDRIETDGYLLDPRDETLHSTAPSPKSTDYAPALWVASPYHSARSVAKPTAVAIHITQGSYAGTISWFQSNPYSVSAHFVIRSSDGQLTQMVREYRVANHVKSHNDYTLGIEHEGYVSNSAWYTSAMYNASSALTRHFCAVWSIDCRTAYSGPSGSTINVLSTAVKIKGHQHFSNNTHTDPGIHWDWARYYNLLNPAQTVVLDNFEAGEGHFTTSPTYSGSTTGISTASTADRYCTFAQSGACSERVLLVDNSASTASWAVRFLSGAGSPGANTALARAGGKVGFWIYTGGTGMSAALGVDDSDGTERSIAKAIPANTWTWLEWRLDDAAQWDAWAGGNGTISAASVTLDAIWLYRAQTSYNVNVYIDDVSHSTGL
ncbi:MAG: N-acetylmuramoyl-L-alanine amidase [Xanthomonadales bacterium]|nr:N-acetylmuramoyl-L-alanine amidase [Xanthomonadales bacterium]